MSIEEYKMWNFEEKLEKPWRKFKENLKRIQKKSDEKLQDD